ncbi:hypothetical protein RJ639_014016 [Escallonia herrerae]|uniref:non-specific serine/threonine protein kinase n=1 Tax=Escallonia herrerae TaxID=1293975 RepID=A0AA89APT6_9ASTE|nr:hypothetical protein RJ639_014016 [Escallonia herrerae]
MSKMKHLLRKLHIGNDHHRMAAADADIRPVSAASPPPHAEATGRASDATAAAGESSVDFSFFEEEFQMQLALAISVSSDRGGSGDGDDAETAQIRAAKERSLGCSPILTNNCKFYIWYVQSNNVINYGEKVMDGFYDVYGTSSNLVTQGKMPLLVDLETVTVSDDVDYEVVLVNRTTDMELQQLEERLCKESLEGQAVEKGLIVNSLIQKIADLVVDKMGGPVSDADEMLKRWTLRRNELRNCLNTIILPLGCLDVGLSRHRALLFKVLADRMNLPCMLVKGSYYTGTDEGAVNLIKFDNGSEYIIDLMGAPGTLIPAEVPSSSLQSSGLDIRFVADFAESSKYSCPMLEKETGTLAVSADLDSIKTGGSSSEVTSIVSISSEGNNRKAVEKNPTEKFEHEFGKLLPSLCRSHEGSSLVGGKSSAQKMQVKDVSKYVISASKNPEFASKLHAVLLESGASPPLDLLSDLNLLDLGEQKVLEQVQMLNGETVGNGPECYPPMFLSNNEQSLVPFTELQPFNNFHFDIKPEQQKWESAIVNHGHSLPSNTTSEGSMFVYGGRNEMVQTDELGLGNIHVERAHESSMFSAASPFDKQPKEFESLMEMENCGQSNACTPHNDKISPALGDVADWEIPWEHLQIGERIGIGSYGEVYRAEWNGTEVAVKKFMDQDISGDALFQFKCEVEIMLRLRHPNVVLFMGAVTRPPHLSILTEFLPRSLIRGSLFKLLHRPNVQLDEKRRLRMALDVAKGMNYLHTSHPIIVHRDLKTPNLLVDKNWNVKVCDFGMSRMKHHTFLSSTSTAGTPEWMAPEVIRNERSNEKSDVYSFGVILWELATLRVPWTELNSMQVVGAVGFQHRHLQIPEEVDPMVGRIITDCWDPNPELRPSFGQIISRLRCLKHLVVGRRGTSADQQ